MPPVQTEKVGIIPLSFYHYHLFVTIIAFTFLCCYLTLLFLLTNAGQATVQVELLP